MHRLRRDEKTIRYILTRLQPRFLKGLFNFTAVHRRVSSLVNLPTDLMCAITSFLDGFEMFDSIPHVCRRWKRISQIRTALGFTGRRLTRWSPRRSGTEHMWVRADFFDPFYQASLPPNVRHVYASMGLPSFDLKQIEELTFEDYGNPPDAFMIAMPNVRRFNLQMCGPGKVNTFFTKGHATLTRLVTSVTLPTDAGFFPECTSLELNLCGNVNLGRDNFPKLKTIRLFAWGPKQVLSGAVPATAEITIDGDIDWEGVDIVHRQSRAFPPDRYRAKHIGGKHVNMGYDPLVESVWISTPTWITTFQWPSLVECEITFTEIVTPVVSFLISTLATARLLREFTVSLPTDAPPVLLPRECGLFAQLRVLRMGFRVVNLERIVDLVPYAHEIGAVNAHRLEKCVCPAWCPLLSSLN